jgi:hypothetical protein
MSSRALKVAVLLPPGPQPGILAAALSLAHSLPEQCGAQVAVGLPTTAVDEWEYTAARFRACGPTVGIRILTWTQLPRDVIVRMFGADVDAPLDVSSAVIPHDRGWSFTDCDCWIVFGDTTLGATTWLRPAVVVAPQLAERYMPAFTEQEDVERRVDTFLSWRRARAVLAATAADRGDLLSYAGVHPDRVRPLPPLSDTSLRTDDHVSPVMEKSAIVWHPAYPWPAPATTAATAWREYLEMGGELPLLIAGRHAEAVASAPAVSRILDYCCRIGGRWTTDPVLPGRRLDRLLDGARMLWSPTIADDSHWLVARALARGMPVAAAESPHLRDALTSDTVSAPTLWTYAAHDIVAGATALMAAATAPPLDVLPSPHSAATSTSMVSWRETLDALRLRCSVD